MSFYNLIYENKKYKPKTKADLKELIDDLDIKLSDIDTSNITDFNELFSGSKRTDFKGIDTWNTSNVVTARRCFYNLKDFNEDISKWNTSKLQDAREMFFKCKSFNQNLNSWDVRNIKTMYRMFYECTNFKQILNKWKVDNCENFSAMFLNVKYVEEHFKEFKWNTRNAAGYSANPFKA